MSTVIHPFADKFPMMPEDELNAMAKDIKDNGQRLPIIRWKGMIIDGRNRLKACEIAGVEPNIKDKDDAFKNEFEIATFIVSMNISRRHISASERATIAVEIMEIAQNQQAMEALEVQHETMKEDREAVNDTENADVPTELLQEEPTLSKIGKVLMEDGEIEEAPKKKTKSAMVKEAADATHTNPTYVHQASKIKEEAPEKYKEVQAGKKTIPEALKEIKEESVQEDEELTPAQAIKLEEKKEAKARKIVEKCEASLAEVGYKLTRTAIEKIS